MKNSNTCIFYLMIAFCIIFAASCGDNSADPDPDGPGGGGGSDRGEATITITGHVERNHVSERADFDYGDSDWTLTMFAGSGDSNHLIRIYTYVDNPEEYVPEPGTYIVKDAGGSSDPIPGVFSASYDNSSNRYHTNASAYFGTELDHCFEEAGGELVITRSSRDEVEGTFTFTMITDYLGECFEIQAEGEFRAVGPWIIG